MRDLLNTYNNEGKKLRVDFERREEEYERKIADLNKALLLQEKKMVDKVIESIDFKHNAYLGRAEQSEFLGRLDKDFEAIRNKRREIQEQIDKDEPKQQATPTPTQPSRVVPVPQTEQSAPAHTPAPKEASKPQAPKQPEPKRVSHDDFDDFEI